MDMSLLHRRNIRYFVIFQKCHWTDIFNQNDSHSTLTQSCIASQTIWMNNITISNIYIIKYTYISSSFISYDILNAPVTKFMKSVYRTALLHSSCTKNNELRSLNRFEIGLRHILNPYRLKNFIKDSRYYI